MEHYFTIISGVIRWIEKMPEYPNVANQFDPYDSVYFADVYEKALQQAIDTSEEVENQQEVLQKIIDAWKRSQSYLIARKENIEIQVYSLECSVEKKEYCPDFADVGRPYDCWDKGSGRHKKVAIVTFDDLEDAVSLREQAENFFNENYSGTEMSDFLKPYIINTYISAKRENPKQQ